MVLRSRGRKIEQKHINSSSSISMMMVMMMMMFMLMLAHTDGVGVISVLNLVHLAQAAFYITDLLKIKM